MSNNTHGGPRTPGPGKRLGRPKANPQHKKHQLVIMCTDDEWRIILEMPPGERVYAILQQAKKHEAPA